MVQIIILRSSTNSKKDIAIYSSTHDILIDAMAGVESIHLALFLVAISCNPAIIPEQIVYSVLHRMSLRCVVIDVIKLWVFQAMYILSDLSQIARWWRHQMKTFSALLDLCVGNSRVTGDFPSKRPVKRRRWWFETLSRLLWRHCNERCCH